MVDTLSYENKKGYVNLFFPGSCPYHNVHDLAFLIIMKPALVTHTCSYTGIDSGMPCTLPASPLSPEGYCIGHAKEQQKPGAQLHQAVMAKIQSNDCVFEEFYFPYRMTWNEISLQVPIQFTRCVFQGGIRLLKSVFLGQRVHFDRCIFMGGSVLMHDCIFDTEEVSFAGCAITGDVVSFSRCSFHGDELDFRDTRWDVSSAILFHQCHFRSRLIGFSGTQWKAPTIAFNEPVASDSPLFFQNGTWEADRLVFKRFHHVNNQVSLRNMSLNCKHVDWQLGRWQGERFSLSQSTWNGSSFTLGGGNTLKGDVVLSDNRFLGDRVSMNSLRSTRGTVQLDGNRFELNEEFDASNMNLGGDWMMDDCSISSPSVRMNRIRTYSPVFRVQNTRFTGKRFRMAQSRFDNQTFAFARNHVDTSTIDFRVSRFDNYQTSFQGSRLKGKTISFQDSRFESPRVSFQRTRFEADRLSFERCVFSQSRVSFWKSRFHGTRVSWKNAVSDNAELVFMTSLENHHFRDHRLDRCDFRGSQWGETSGMLRRPLLADEKPMQRTGRLSELMDLYQWIARQYAEVGEFSRSETFLLACRLVERRLKRTPKNRSALAPVPYVNVKNRVELPPLREAAILILLLTRLR